MSESILVLEYNINKTTENIKIASFDLDSTIIFTKSKKTFAINKNDWKIDNIVLDKLRDLHNDNYKIIFITNQNGIHSGRQNKNEFIEKCNDIVEYINIPILILASILDDLNRKPRVGMWDYIKHNFYPNIDMSYSFYCGDAAGRDSDFSCSDYKFALNLDILFYTPEQLFYNDTSDYNCKSSYRNLNFNPEDHFNNKDLNEQFDYEINNLQDVIKLYNKNLIILVGSPASSKSTFVKTYLSKYDIISQDVLLTAAKCKKKCIEYINNNTNDHHNIVIDNCNKNVKARSLWVDIANLYKYNIIIIKFYMCKDYSLHMNKFRSLTSDKQIPNIAIHSFYKNYEEPTCDEYDYIFNMPIVLDKNYNPLIKKFLI